MWNTVWQHVWPGWDAIWPNILASVITGTIAWLWARRHLRLLHARHDQHDRHLAELRGDQPTRMEDPVTRRVLAWFRHYDLEIVVAGMALMVASRLLGLAW